MNKDDGFSKVGGGAELEAVWGKGYARDKERSRVYTNLSAAGILEGSQEI